MTKVGELARNDIDGAEVVYRAALRRGDLAEALDVAHEVYRLQDDPTELIERLRTLSTPDGRFRATFKSTIESSSPLEGLAQIMGVLAFCFMPLTFHFGLGLHGVVSALQPPFKRLADALEPICYQIDPLGMRAVGMLRGHGFRFS